MAFALTDLDYQMVALAAAAGCTLLSLLVLGLWLRQRRLLHRYRLLLGGPRGGDLETLLLRQAATIEELQALVATLQRDLGAQLKNARRHVQHVGIVRFQAFPETGADLSFALAVLDGRHDGFVLSSLYGRSETRVFAKPIRAGTSTYSLTDEEREAIAKATAP